MKYAILSVPLCLLACAAPTDVVRLTPAAGQEAIVRDGVPSLISKKRHVVMLRPVSHIQVSSGRPRFVLAVLNRGQQPTTLQTADITANLIGKKQLALRIFRYDELMQEVEDQRKVALTFAVLGGVAGAMSAANAGYSHTSGSVYSGGYQASYNATTYNPAMAQMASNQNAANTANNIENIQANGDAQLSHLKDTILKDHTIMPGEWHGGVIVLDAPEKEDNGRVEYSIAVPFDQDMHAFTVTQARTN